ncbi:MAG: NADH-quinone oxidoreductase subunit NuoH [Planctomycetota bacterium]
MIAAAEPLSHHIGIWLAGLVGLEANWLFHSIGMLVVAVGVLGLVITPGALAGIYLERKIAGRVQNRYGPNRVGPWGLLQTLADGVKLLTKEDVVRRGMDEPLFRFAPYVVFIAAFAGFVVLPFAPNLTPVDLDVGVFFFLALIALETIGIIMAGWSSNNKWSLLGSMREVAQVVSYELPLGIAAMCPVLAAGTMSVKGITDYQAGSIFSWFILRNGYWAIVMVPAFFIFYTSALAACKRAPFDLPEAESELVAGFHTEYSGMRFGMFFLPEYALMLSISGVMAALFLGGYHDPLGLSAPGRSMHGVWWWGLIWFSSKTVVIWLSMMVVRWTLPRLRIDQVMYLCYKVLLPVAMACLVGAAALRLLG